MRKLLLLILILSLTCTSVAQEGPTIEWHIKPGPGDITKNIHFIVDNSESMDGEQLIAAISQALEIAGQSVDEVNVAVTMFGGNYDRWGGIEGSPLGWAAFPSADALEKMKEYLEYRGKINITATEVIPPLKNALNEKIDDLTVIIISDMIFLDMELKEKPLSHIINPLLREREDNGLTTRIGFIGIHSREWQMSRIIQTAQECGAWVCNRLY